MAIQNWRRTPCCSRWFLAAHKVRYIESFRIYIIFSREVGNIHCLAGGWFSGRLRRGRHNKRAQRNLWDRITGHWNTKKKIIFNHHFNYYMYTYINDTIIYMDVIHCIILIRFECKSVFILCLLNISDMSSRSPYVQCIGQRAIGSRGREILLVKQLNVIIFINNNYRSGSSRYDVRMKFMRWKHWLFGVMRLCRPHAKATANEVIVHSQNLLFSVCDIFFSLISFFCEFEKIEWFWTQLEHGSKWRSIL